jgi:hypothetical protein
VVSEDKFYDVGQRVIANLDKLPGTIKKVLPSNNGYLIEDDDGTLWQGYPSADFTVINE